MMLKSIIVIKQGMISPKTETKYDLQLLKLKIMLQAKNTIYIKTNIGLKIVITLNRNEQQKIS
tara:strand:+ start:140 stop:328 length:189 start_codon:yes stop_codon:yes gene_type:complete